MICWTLSRSLPAVCKWNADASTYVFHPAGAFAPDSELEKCLEAIDGDDFDPNELPATPEATKCKVIGNAVLPLQSKLCNYVMLVVMLEELV